MEVESILNDETSASWWITHREKEIGEVLPFMGGAGKTTVKPKGSSPVPSSLLVKKMSYEACTDGDNRYVRELKDIVTGKVVVDPNCPF